MLYYFGDDIFFNLCLLGKIHEYYKINNYLEIKTLPKYVFVLKMLYRDKICCVEANNYSKSDISILKFFNIKEKNQYKFDYTLSYKDEKLLDKYNLENIVCVKLKNNKLESKIKNIIKETFLFKNYNIININNKINILETIYLLNKNILFITDDLKSISWAINCSTKNIGYITDEVIPPILTNYHNIQYIQLNNNLSIPKFRMNFTIKNFLQIKKSNKPFVSCVCPTFNRHKFIPNLIKIFQNQNYPADCRELIILDDSPSNISSIIRELDKENNIKYYNLDIDKPYNIGKKRNLLNQLVSGEYIICFDDDDYYPSNRISHVIEKLSVSDIKFAGSSKIYIYYTDIDKIYEFGPYGKNHATNGTFAYHYSYLSNNIYDDDATYAEEKVFLNNYQEQLVQLEPENTILCISHGKNTFDKKKVIHMGKISKYKLTDFINDKNLLNYYKTL